MNTAILSDNYVNVIMAKKFIRIVEDYNPAAQHNYAPRGYNPAREVYENWRLLTCMAQQGDLSTLLLIRGLNKRCFEAAEKALTQLWNVFYRTPLHRHFWNEFSKEFYMKKVVYSVIGKFLDKGALKDWDKDLHIRDKANGLLAVLRYKQTARILLGHLAVHDIPVTSEKLEKRLHESFESINICWEAGLKETIAGADIDLTELEETITKLEKMDEEIKKKEFRKGTELRLHIHKIVNDKQRYDKLKKIQTFAFKKLALKMLPLPPCAMEGVKILSLQQNQLGIFPVLHLENLRELDLSHNHLKSIDLTYCPSLKKLCLTHNQFEHFSALGLKYLQDLDLSHNHLKSIDLIYCRCFKKNTMEDKNLNLIKLDLSYNQLECIDLTYCRYLESLYLRDNQLTSIDLTYFRSLKKLHLENNQLKRLEALWSERLETLNLSGNRSTWINVPFCHNLNTLIARENQLAKIPIDIYSLKNLRVLDVCYNKIGVVEKDIQKLKTLKCLSLSGNAMKTLPEEIARLTNLKGLSICSEELTELPKQIWNLKSLTAISIGYTQSEGFLNKTKNFMQLKKLYIRYSSLTEFPENICSLSELETLEISASKLSNISKKIGELKKLKTLILHSNNLKDIPDEICSLENLEKIDISNNQLVAIPKEIFNVLPNLKELNLVANQRGLEQFVREINPSLAKVVGFEDLSK